MAAGIPTVAEIKRAAAERYGVTVADIDGQGLPSKGEVVAALHEACGREVLIVTSGAEEYLGESAPAKIDADQPKMPGIGDEYDEAA